MGDNKNIATKELTLLQAINEGLFQALENNSNVLLFGEDIGTYGGAFKVTEGLIEAYGPERIIETPIAEAAVIGAAAGAAMCGLPSVAELQFMDFISCGGFDQMVTVAAKSRYRNGVGCPLVVRGPCGGGNRGGPFHSTSPEMWLVSTPGFKVVFPSTPFDAKGLLQAAINDPDPVLFLEHKYLYRRAKGAVPTHSYEIPLGQAAVRREGADATVLTYGAMVNPALEAAEKVTSQGLNVRVIDLRTLSPLDEKTIVQAVQETNRILIVHEHPKSGGLAGEICAIINEQAFDYLDAPIMRVTAPDTPVPYAPTLEDSYLPQADDIGTKLIELCRY